MRRDPMARAGLPAPPRAVARFRHNPACGLEPCPALPCPFTRRAPYRSRLDHNATARFCWVAERMQNHDPGRKARPSLQTLLQPRHWNSFVTGSELKQLRSDLGEAIGRPLTAVDMAKLCGLPAGNGGDTIRRWEVSGPSGPAGELLRILAMACDRYPILENFNIFDRHNVPEKDRPARREEFREQMRDEVRRRLA